MSECQHEVDVTNTCIKCGKPILKYAVRTEDIAPYCCDNVKPNYTFMFSNTGNKEIGKLDFNGATMQFTGDADASAKIFLDLVMTYFEGRLEEERKTVARDIAIELKCMDVNTTWIRDRYKL